MRNCFLFQKLFHMKNEELKSTYIWEGYKKEHRLIVVRMINMLSSGS